MRQLSVILGTVATFLSTANAQAPHRVVITGPPKCESCRIAFTKVATIGAETDSVVPGPYSIPRRTSRGYFVLAPAQGTSVALYGPQGRLIRTFGRRGKGPGEFATVSKIEIGPGDTVHVFDGMSGRMTVLSPELALVRTVPVPAMPNGVLFLPGGDVLMQASMRTASGVGMPLHRMTSDGSVKASFGEAEKPVASTTFIPRRPLAFAGRRDRVWLGQANRYVIQRLDLSGRADLLIERRVEWFQPWEAPPGEWFDEARPNSAMAAVSDPGDGTLWVITTVADASWQRAERTKSEDGFAVGTSPYSVAEIDSYFDSIIEILNPERGEVIVSHRNPMILAGGFIGENVVATRRETNDGYLLFDVWRVELTGRKH